MRLHIKIMAALLSCHLTIFPSFIKEIFPVISGFSFHLTMENLVPFKGSLDTLDKVRKIIEKKEKGVYLRFEDTDLEFLSGSSKFSKELRSVFSLNGNNIIKTLPLYPKEVGIFENGILPVYDKNLFKSCTSILKKAAKIWGGKVKEVYSPFALHYAAVNYTKSAISFLKFLKRNNCCLFVGYEDIPKKLVSLLFGENCNFISVSKLKNYNNINDIERECLQKIIDNKKYKIIVTSCGPLGRVLQKRLWSKLDNAFLFDFDSLIYTLCGNKNSNNFIKNNNFDSKDFLQNLSGKTKILCTAAVLNKHFEGRKAEYIKSIKGISNFGYEPYIVEACKKGNTFLDSYSSHVFYSNVNNLRLKNKGVNEARSLIESFKHFNFNDNDMIIKLTGRYFFEDNFFVNLVENNPDVDAFVKLYANLGGGFWAFSGCFALKAKYFKDFLYNLDFSKMENRGIALEQELLDYIQILENMKAKIIYVDDLHVASHVYFSGGGYNPNKLTHW